MNCGSILDSGILPELIENTAEILKIQALALSYRGGGRTWVWGFGAWVNGAGGAGGRMERGSGPGYF